MWIDHARVAYALYIRFSDKPYAYGEDIDRERRVDYAEDGTPIGVELLCADQGVDLRDLPHADRLADVLRGHAIRILG